MKKKIHKIFGLGLTLVMVLSLAVAFAPVAMAADYEENDWGEWGLPDTEPYTDIGPIAVAPDGTLFAAVFYWDDTDADTNVDNDEWFWKVAMSEDDGYTWDDTDLDDLQSNSGTPGMNSIVGIAVSGNYAEDETLYVGIYADDGGEPVVWRLEEAGDEATSIKPLVDSHGDEAHFLYSIDVFTDEDDYNWIMAGTDLDALVLKDKVFEDWRDQELGAVYPYWWDVPGEPKTFALEVAFAPDFDSSELIWAVIPQHEVTGTLGTSGGDSTATWSTTRVHSGSFSAKLDFDDAHTYVDFVPAAGTTGDDFADAAAADFGFWYYQEEESGFGPQLELKFEDPGSSDYIDITFMLQSNTTLGAWTEVDIGDTFGAIGGWDGTTFTAYADLAAAQTAMDGSDFELTKVRVELYNDPAPARTCYIDEVTIDGITYDLEPGGTLVTSTESPGNWGQVVDEAAIIDAADIPVSAIYSPDIGFPDNYDSDPDTADTILFVGVSGSGGDSGVYLVEGVDGDGDPTDFESVSVEITDGETDLDGEYINSIAVSGDYGDDLVILAGLVEYPEVWISDDGDGEDWDVADKSPTGEGPTYVCMEADVVWGGAVFDTEESMAFATTFGDESAISRSNDGGWVYNQVGYIDHTIDELWDLAFHPDFPDEAIFFLITADVTDSPDTSSLWLTENGDEDDPDYIRVLCGVVDGGPPGNIDAFFGDLTDYHGLVEFAQDASAIYLHGEDEGDDESIWKSTDDGQTFDKKRDVEAGTTPAEIIDWVITDDDTIYAAVQGAGDYGFYKTVNSGLSWADVDTGGEMNSIALSPDFDADDEVGYILLGGLSGEIMLSDDVGDTFDDAEDEEQSALSDTAAICVAFDADFDDEDADGYMHIYAADDAGSDIQFGEVADTDDVDWDDLEDDENEAVQAIYCAGLQVAEDNALYAIGETTEAVTEVVTVDGTFDIADGHEHSDEIIIGDAIEVDVISGTFEEDGASVVSTNLWVISSTVVSGTIYIEQGTALGSFDITILTSGMTVDAEITVSDEALDIDVTEETVGVGLVRLLLDESDSEWESQSDTSLVTPMGLWLTPGTNVLWTIDIDSSATVAPDVWALEDTCSGQVTLDSPPSGYKSDYEDQMRVSWDEVRDADEYEVKYYHLDTGDSDVEDEIEDTDVLLTQLNASSEYEWKVRVSPGEPWHSRWSDKWSFYTALGEPPWAPTLYAPANGEDEALLTPAFSWEPAKTADSYDFMLASDAGFSNVIVHEKVSQDAYTPDVTLDNDTTYYWKVQAYKGTKAISRWSDVSVFTTTSKAVAPPPPITVPPAPTPTLIVEPVIQPIPIPLWALIAVIAIGGVLLIGVIVLIVRTRRAI